MATPPKKKRQSPEETRPSLEELYIQSRQSTETRPSLEELYAETHGAQPAPDAERPGLTTRFLNRAAVRGMNIAANLGEMMAGIPSPGARPVADLPAARAQGAAFGQQVRGTAEKLEAKVPEAQTPLEYAASIAGYAAPDILATMLGAKGMQAAAEGVGATSGLGRLLSPAAGAGIVRRNIAGAIASAPLVSIPGALAADGSQSPTGLLVEYFTGKRPGPVARMAGDLALETGGGIIGETLISPLASILGKQAKAAPGAAVEDALTGPITTPAAPAAPRLLGRGAIPMGPIGWREREMLESAIRFAEEQRARRPISQPVPPPAAAPEVELSPTARLEAAAQQARAAATGAPAIEIPTALSPRTTRQQKNLRRQMAQSAQQIQADIDDRRAMAMPDMEATRQLEAAAEAGRQQRAAEPKASIEMLSALGGAGIGGIGGSVQGQPDEDMTPVQRALTYATIGAGLASGKSRAAIRALARNIPSEAGELGVSTAARRRAVTAIPQEVRAVGRFGFVKPPKEYVLDEAIEREHLANVLAATEPTLSQIGARSQETVNGAGLFGGDVSPNSIMRFAENAPDEELRTAAAVRGLAFGQDQQLWYRKARPTDTEGTAAVVITGRDFAELSDEAINAVVSRLRADDALGPYGGATRDGNHLLALNLKRYTGMDDEAFQQAVAKAVDEVAQSFDIDIHPSSYYAEHLDGNADYVRTLGRRPDALRAARTALVDAQPEYLRYAAAVGADVKAAEKEIAARIESIDRLIRQVEEPPPLGRTQDAVPVADAAKQVYTQFPRLNAEADEAVVPEMTLRLTKMVDDLVDQGVIPREMAQDFYRGATLDQRQIARLALPELREDPKYTLYTVVNSILSSGQQVPVETRQGLNVFDQYLRTGRFSILDPSDAQYKTALTGGKKAFTGERGTGLLGEAMAASPRTLNHEQALARLDALVQALGEEGAVNALVERVPIMAGREVKEERPSLVYLFGPKIGQYAMDKLGILNDGNKSTIDLWMARLDYALRGDAGGIEGNKLNDAVSPTMRRRMQQVLGQYAEQNGMPESSAQALAWYAIKNAFRNAGAREKRMAYATLGSATTDALMTPIAKELGAGPLAQGLVKNEGSYAAAAEGWNDPTLKGFAKRTGREGTIAPTAGALAGKVFDIGGAFGASLGTQFGREALPKVGLGVAGYELEQNVEDPRLKATGQGLQLLSMASLGYRPSKALIRSGAINVRDALAQSPQGRTALNLISRDILIDPKVKAVVELAEREMAKYRAIGLDLAQQARKLGPEGDRLVSDLVENERIESRAGMDDETIKSAMAVAQKVAQEVSGLGREKVATGIISKETYDRRMASYLKRFYAAFKGAEAMQPVTIRKGGKIFRIEPERVRNENLSLEERNALGEIREASVRLGETFTEGGRNIATSRLFNALAGIDGVIPPVYKQAMDEAENARLLSDAAYASGDTEMGKAARSAEREAKRRMKGLAQEIASSDNEYIVLPDTPKLSFLRGAVVRKDAAEYLMTMPDIGIERLGTRGLFGELTRFWKRVHTVYNPGTHVANFISNASKVHMGGLPLAEQLGYLKGAWNDLRSYGPATKALAEAGVLERGLPTYGDMAVSGLASQKNTLQQLVETTRPETRQALTARGITPRSDLQKVTGWASQRAQQAYALEDGLYRVALYKKLLDNNMAPDEALKEVERVLPGYDTRSPLLMGIKNTVSPFIMYPVKYIPSLMEDIMDHPVRWVTLAALWGGLDQLSRRMYTPVQDRDLRPEQRQSKSLGYLMPGTIQVDLLMRPLAKALGAEPKRGEQYTFDISRFTPLSLFSGSPAPGSVVGKLFPEVPGASILQPSGFIPELASRAFNIDPFTGRKWMTGGETAGQKAQMIAEDVVLPFVTPTAISYYVKKMVKESIPGENRAEILSDVMGLVGARPQFVRPGMQAKYERQDFMEQLRAVKAKRDAQLRNTESPQRRKELMQEAAADLQRIRNKYYAKRIELGGGENK